MASHSSLAAVEAGILFDRSYYLASNKDVASQKVIDPMTHFLSHGGLEGRDPHPLFDSSYYLEKHSHLIAEGENPLLHFLAEGAKNRLDPHPLFSTEYYLGQGLSMEDCSFNPLLHYLRVGAAAGLDPHPLFDGKFYRNQLTKSEEGAEGFNPLVHYLAIGAERGLQPSPAFDARSYCIRYRDVALARINPLIHYVTQGQRECRAGGTMDNDAARDSKYHSALSALLAETEKPFTHLIVTSCLVRGGSERCVANFAAAIAQRVGADNVVILVTDFRSITCGDWLPDGVRIANILQIDHDLTEEQRGLLFLDLLMIRQPAFALGMNAATFWSVLDTHMSSWVGKLETKLVGYLGHYEPFVNDNDYGFNDGPMSRLIDRMHLFIVDNIRLRDAMLERHSDRTDLHLKVVVCYKSLTESLHKSLSEKSASINTANKKIVWASRFTRVKLPHILWQVAEKMPDVQFLVYGRKMPHWEDLSFMRPLPNVTLMGEYAGFEDIDTNDVSAFLYTSCADSMPHVLVEAGACGLPIVAPDIGAIRELINDQTGWLLPESDDVSAYISTLRFLHEHPDKAVERAEKLKALIGDRHNWSGFQNRINALNIWKNDSVIADLADSPLFDRAYYLKQNPDVAKNSEVDPLKHFIERGGQEGRDPHPLFDSSFYLEHPELAELQINPLIHYLHDGASKGLDPHPLFSTSFYLSQMQQANVCSINPLIHYLEFGAKSGLSPHPLFDSKFYTQQMELIEGKPISCNPLLHYLCEGAQQGLNPSSTFDGNAYYRRYPDVRAARVNPLIHYVAQGQAEGRIGTASDISRSQTSYSEQMRSWKVQLLQKLGVYRHTGLKERTEILGRSFDIPVAHDCGTELLSFQPSFTYDILKLFQKHLQVEDFVDIGAHIGQTLLEVRLASSQIRYFGFEPNLHAYEILSELIKANKFECYVRQIGLSDTQEVIPLFKGSPLDGAATILPNTRPGKYQHDDCEQIECLRLDDAIEEFQSLHQPLRKHFVLKIDVEGAEFKVLSGATECISSLRPIILCEVLHAHNAQSLGESRRNKSQIQKALAELNYQLYQIVLNPGQAHRQRLKSIRQISEFPVSIYSRSPHTCEFLFLPKELSDAISF